MVSREALSDFGWPACEYLKRTGCWRGGHVAVGDWPVLVRGVPSVAAGDLLSDNPVRLWPSGSPRWIRCGHPSLQLGTGWSLFSSLNILVF
jgi:hypothetical protein